MNQSRSLKILYVAVSLVAGILFAILYSLTPASTDDLLFLLPAKGMNPGMDLFNLMCNQIPEIWATQSGRLGNFIALPFLYLFPKWVFGILSGIAVTFLLNLSCKLTYTKRGSIVSWLLMAVIIFAFPWYDYMFLITYSCNYLWASVITVAALCAFQRIRSLTGIKLAGAFLLMFLAGWMHEGFGAPFTAAIGLCLICNLRTIKWKEYSSFLIAAAGTGVTFLSPTFWSRSVSGANKITQFPFTEAVLQLGPALLLFLVFLISIVILLNKNKHHNTYLNVRKRNLIILTSGFCIASAVVFLKYYCGPRTGAPLLLLSAIGCAATFTTLYKNKHNHVLQWLFCIIVSFGVLTNLIFAIIKQHQLKREYDDIVNLFEASENGTFFYDLSYPVADATLFKTSVRQFHEKVPIRFWEIYYGPEKKMVILPSAMKGFSPSKSRKSRYTPEALIYNGWIVLPDDFDIDSHKQIKILLEDGTVKATRFRHDDFTGQDGNKYTLISPHKKILNPDIIIKDVIIAEPTK